MIAQLRASGLANPLGIVAEASYEGDYWRELRADQKQDCAAFLHYPRTRPDFLSWHVDDLPHPTPALLRALAALPVMVWTVRTAEQKRRARLWADQIVFERGGRRREFRSLTRIIWARAPSGIGGSNVSVATAR